MFKPGDKFIRFSSYGSITVGIVAEYGETHVFDLNNKMIYNKPYIKTTKGYILELDGSDGKVYKVTKELTDEDIESRRAFMALTKQEKLNHIKKQLDVRRKKEIAV